MKEIHVRPFSLRSLVVLWKNKTNQIRVTALKFTQNIPRTISRAVVIAHNMKGEICFLDQEPIKGSLNKGGVVVGGAGNGNHRGSNALRPLTENGLFFWQTL
jgi:hypothetical protein